MVEKMMNVFWSEELGLNCVDGRGLHETLIVSKDFTDWMKDQLRRVDAKEGEDYIIKYIDTRVPFKGEVAITSVEPPKKEKWAFKITYIIALDIAKEICMVVGAAPRTNSETKKISKEIRQYFIECERLLSKEQKEQVEQLLEEKRNRTVTVHERNAISSSVNLKADESKNSRDEAKKIKNFIFNKYDIKSYGEIKQVDMPVVLQIVNQWKVSDRKDNLFNLIG